MKLLTVDLGQPYALRQAGLGAGVFLLVALTIVVRRPPDPPFSNKLGWTN